MTISKKITRPQNQYQLQNRSYMDGRCGFWGNIISVNSETMRASVKSDTGMVFVGIPLTSREWVNKTDNFVTGERNIPQKNSRVFVLMPTRTIEGSFILCSGYAAGDSDTKALFASEDDAEEKNKIYERVTQSGWNETENYETGNRKEVSHDENIKIEKNLSGDGSSIKKGFIINAFGNEITINEDGIEIKDKNNNVIEMSGTSVKINNNFEVLQ